MVFAIGWKTENDPEAEAVEKDEMITAFVYYPIDSECTARAQDAFHQLGVTVSKDVCKDLKTGQPVILEDDWKENWH
jgi:hypothetical protein